MKTVASVVYRDGPEPLDGSAGASHSGRRSPVRAFTAWQPGLMGLCLLLVAARGAEPSQFEVRISTQDGRNAIEMVQTCSATTARDIIEARYPGVDIVSLQELDRPSGREWYLARLSVAGVNVEDTVLARGSGDARRVFASRFPEGRIVSLTALTNTAGHAFYEGVIHGAGPKVFKDAVLASGANAAAKALRARYPSARVDGVVEMKGRAPVTATQALRKQAEDAEELARRQEAAAVKERVQQARQDEKRAVAQAVKAAQKEKKDAVRESAEAQKAARDAGRAGTITQAEVGERIRQARKEAAAAILKADRDVRATKEAARKAVKAAGR